MRVAGGFGERALEKDSFLESLNRIWAPLLRKLLEAHNGLSNSAEFTQADLNSNVLLFTHGLGSPVVSASLIDDSGVLRYDVLADNALVVVNINVVHLDLDAEAPISGTWTLLIRRD